MIVTGNAVIAEMRWVIVSQSVCIGKSEDGTIQSSHAVSRSVSESDSSSNSDEALLSVSTGDGIMVLEHFSYSFFSSGLVYLVCLSTADLLQDRDKSFSAIAQ